MTDKDKLAKCLLQIVDNAREAYSIAADLDDVVMARRLLIILEDAGALRDKVIAYKLREDIKNAQRF